MKSAPATSFVALLRAVNVGGTATLPMAQLAALCADLGLAGVRTYIQSGNVVFKSPLGEEKIRLQLEKALSKEMGKPIDILIRTGAALSTVLAANPFPQADPSRVGILFLPAPPPASLVKGLVIPGREEIVGIGREVYVHYPDGMGRSKLKLAALGTGTMRNGNTVAKLAALAAE